MSKQRKSPRAAFLVTVAGTAAVMLAPACSSDVETNPPFPDDCPTTLPSHGDTCTAFDVACPYTDECGSTATATCSAFDSAKESTWSLSTDGPPCNPPNPCPTDSPAGGDACSEEGLSCDYQEDIGCGPQPKSASCAGGTWSVSFDSTCNPPAP